jgi:putative spermidine/putrescine transport system substrate-binding protein
MNKIQKGACAQYHANAPASYFDSIRFWKTPTTRCDNGQSDCTDYNDWQQKWTEIKG